MTRLDPDEAMRRMLRADARAGAPTPSCPDDDTVAALVEGTLDAARREVVLPHVATCAWCRDAVASVTRALADDRVAREVNGAPVWSPDGLAIAFATSRDLDDEIYKMNADGSAPVNLTLRAGSDREPAWSPNGQTIAFASTRNDQGDSVPAEIFVMAPDGSGKRTALTANSGGSTSPEWSPDGTRIAFVTVRDGNAEIYVMNADGNSPVDLTVNPAADDHPVWSPDGTQIAFFSDRDGSRAVYVMRADGSALTTVASGSAVSDDYVSWSPDGANLALTAAGIVVANVSGSGTTRLLADVPTHCVNGRGFRACVNSLASTPTWSPDGTKIAYHLMTKSCRTRAATCTPANPFSSIRIMNPDGTSQVVLTSEAGLGAMRPVWRP